MRMFKPPVYYHDTNPNRTSIFLAGGITGCPDWQAEMAGVLKSENIDIFNPRRDSFPIGDPNAAYEQIIWERDHLHSASAILFWFPCETLCPITLYELGAWSMTRKPLAVGCHPDYKRIADVRIQTGLVRPEITVVTSLEALAGKVFKWLYS